MKCANYSGGPYIWYGWKTGGYKYFCGIGFINLTLRDITYSLVLPNTGAFDPLLTADWKKKQHQGPGKGAMIMQNSLNSYQQLSVVAQLTFPWALSVRSTSPAVLSAILTWLPLRTSTDSLCKILKWSTFYKFGPSVSIIEQRIKLASPLPRRAAG